MKWESAGSGHQLSSRGRKKTTGRWVNAPQTMAPAVMVAYTATTTLGLNTGGRGSSDMGGRVAEEERQCEEGDSNPHEVALTRPST